MSTPTIVVVENTHLPHALHEWRTGTFRDFESSGRVLYPVRRSAERLCAIFILAFDAFASPRSLWLLVAMDGVEKPLSEPED